ncbi:hypothetical protein T265_03279 [Opisthorchis viverrini]|uniref:Uncharacterized protein n=1 Tax=Opisthorchis viverrini TaxID=6198 RepID=A0A074ZWF9_OPIVI|nr:hypothetical protein T265_03279 [Opisthorchis viverrini]KER30217.1 hypothetical protein T265_03279 [Opisthorchis viverrini]
MTTQTGLLALALSFLRTSDKFTIDSTVLSSAGEQIRSSLEEDPPSEPVKSTKRSVGHEEITPLGKKDVNPSLENVDMTRCWKNNLERMKSQLHSGEDENSCPAMGN